MAEQRERERECKISQMIKEGNVSFVRIKFSFNFFLPEAFLSFVAEAEVWIWMNLMKKEKEWRNWLQMRARTIKTAN